MAPDKIRLSLVVFVFYMSVVCVRCKDDFNKTILLNDTDYVQQLITRHQGELQTLQTTVQTQHRELQTLQITVQTLQTTVQTQHGDLQTLQTKVQTQDVELQTLQTTVQNQNGSISSLKTQRSQANDSNGGSTFVRWGRTYCPANLTELVYSGYAGGSSFGHSGAAADYLCLPSDPEWLQTTVVPGNYTGRIYGAEYQSHTGHTPIGAQSHDEGVPCTVCRSTSFVSSVMIPARTTCYSGWTKAYSGSLASGYYKHPAASQYICVDEKAGRLVGGADRNDNVKLFLGVKAVCGSLRCPPYKQDKYISCVVCMK